MHKTLISLTLIALLSAACGTEEGAAGPTAPSSATSPAQLDGAWVLVTASIDDESLSLRDDYRVTMTIEGSEIGGTAACNSYGGSVAIGEGSFTVGELGQTEMGCQPPIMELETKFLGGLIRVTSAERTGDIVSLWGPEVQLRFELLPPVPTSELIGVNWVLETVVEGEAATSTADGADPATLRLESDGTLTGHTGCRGLSGEYVVTGDTVVFTSFAADGECRPGVQRQDNQVVTVLGDGFTVAVDGDRLTLTASGNEALVYRAER